MTNSAKKEIYPQVIVVGGPTASGKSALAAAIAAALNGIVINADSQQLYREIPILSGAPTAAEQKGAEHRLFGVLSVAQPASAGVWANLAKKEIARAIEMKKLPVLVGGTGLYLRALISGIADIPEIPASLRAEVQHKREKLGAEKFFAELQKLDPIAGAKLNPGDTQRTLRAYEVVAHTGKSQFSYKEEAGQSLPYDFFKILVLPPRDEIYARCKARFDGMMQAGALEEARAIEAMRVNPTLASVKALGIPALRAHLRGEMALEDAAAQARLETRQYAKRQYTWFKKQFPADMVIEKVADEKDAAQCIGRITAP